MTLWAYFFDENVLSYLHIFIVYTNGISHWNRPFSWESSIVRQLRPKCHIVQIMTFGNYNTFLRNQTCHIKGGERYLEMVEAIEHGYYAPRLDHIFIQPWAGSREHGQDMHGEDQAIKEAWEGWDPAKWRCDLARGGYYGKTLSPVLISYYKAKLENSIRYLHALF